MHWVISLTDSLIQHLNPGPNFINLDINTKILIINIYNIILENSIHVNDDKILTLTELLLSFGLLN